MRAGRRSTVDDVMDNAPQAEGEAFAQDFGSVDTEVANVPETPDNPLGTEAQDDKPEKKRKPKTPTDPRVFRVVVTQTFGPLNDDQIWSLATKLYDSGQIGGEGTSTQRPVRAAASDWLGVNDVNSLSEQSAQAQISENFEKALKVNPLAEILGYKSEFTAAPVEKTEDMPAAKNA